MASETPWQFYGRLDRAALAACRNDGPAGGSPRPLFNRTTDTLELGHLDIASVLEILRAHADDDPQRLLAQAFHLQQGAMT